MKVTFDHRPRSNRLTRVLLALPTSSPPPSFSSPAFSLLPDDQPPFSLSPSLSFSFSLSLLSLLPSPSPSPLPPSISPPFHEEKKTLANCLHGNHFVRNFSSFFPRGRREEQFLFPSASNWTGRFIKSRWSPPLFQHRWNYDISSTLILSSSTRSGWNKV